MNRREPSAAGGPVPLLLLCSLSLLAGSAWFVNYRQFASEGRVTNRPIQIESDGYASSNACQSCHPAEYASWHKSYHRTMTQLATSQTVIPSFDDVLVENVYGGEVRLERRGDEFWSSFEDPDWNETGVRPRIARRVVMITGSHHQQVYWYSTGHGRLLGQLPAAYLIAERRWIPRRAAVLHPPADPIFSETGHWNSTCIACHATHGKPEFDSPFGSRPVQTQTIQTTAGEFGIACEACHGPAEQHLRSNRSPLRRYWLHLTGVSDGTTVLPTRLKPRLSSQVCGQCHSVWEFYDQQGERQSNFSGLPYRPGDDLSATRFVAQPTRNIEAATMKTLLSEDKGFIRDSFWSDGMVRVTGREYNGLIESPCYRRATDDTRTLSCFSCHVMHRKPGDPRAGRIWADAQLAPDMESNEACLQCHSSMRAQVTAHTKHRAESAGSSCYNCHMPRTTYGLLKTTRSHQISSPSVEAGGATARPNACNLCHLDKTLAWTSEQLEKWYGMPKTAFAGDEAAIAASVLWLLRGDAAQRVIMAQTFGWQPAQQASGTGWMPFYLAQLMDDPYEAVRFIAFRSLRGLPGFDRLAYDFVGPPKERFDAVLRAVDLWRSGKSGPRPADAHLLLNPDGTLQGEVVTRLLSARDHRRVLLRE
jgi:hypothetical protein